MLELETPPLLSSFLCLLVEEEVYRACFFVFFLMGRPHANLMAIKKKMAGLLPWR